MNCIILACSSLADYVRAAQKKLGTNYPEIYLDKRLHADPKKMRDSILEKLNDVSEEYDTVLVAMGFCGGSWSNIKTNKRIVRPAVDDCVSLLLHSDKVSGYNLKKEGHLYMKDKNPNDFDIQKTFSNYTHDMDKETKHKIEASWKSIYSVIDVVDTGINNCNSSEYRIVAEKNASWLDGNVEYLNGSNILIEKLIAGDWDEKLFLIE